MPLPPDLVDFDNAELFLTKAREAHARGDEKEFDAAATRHLGGHV